MRKTLMSSVAVAVTAFVLAGAVHAVNVLTAKNGMTLYVFDKDSGGTPTCYADCAKHWPPYLGTTGAAKNENWTLVQRKDGSMQWAYDGKPVYFYADDKKKGDMKGDGEGGAWHIVTE